MEDRLSLRAWLWTVGTCVVFLAACFVPVPGIDHEAMRALAGSQGGLLGLFNVSVPTISLVSQSVGLLLVVRGVLRLIAREDGPSSPWAARIGFAVYIALAFGTGLVSAIWAESAGMPFGDSLLVDPGWASRLLVALSLAAGAALVWALATVVSRRGVGQGPLVLFGATALAAGAGRLASVGPDLERGEQPLFFLVGLLASIAAPAIVLVAIWAYRPERWPIRIVRGVHVTSPIDLLSLPPLATAFVLAPTGTVLTSLSEPSAVGQWGALAHGIVTAGAAAAVALGLRRRPAGRGSGAWLVVVVVYAALAMGIVVASLVGSGVLGRLTAPGPYEGGRTAIVDLVADGGDGPRDAEILVRRFGEVGLEARVRKARRGLIQLEVREVGDLAGALAAVLPPRRVTFRLVVEAHAGRFDGGPPEGPDVQELLEPGPPLIGPDDIADASVQFDAYDGRPNVALQFTSAAAERFGAATEASIGRLLAIVVDDEILSAPRIASAIPGGRAQITLGSAASYEELLREAQNLVIALKSGPLGSRWAVASER